MDGKQVASKCVNKNLTKNGNDSLRQCMFQAMYSDDQIGEHTYHNHDNAWFVVAVKGSQHQKMSFGDQHDRNVF